jgi:hypothetical protein
MKLLILLSFLLGSAAVAAPVVEELEDDSPSRITTYTTYPGIQNSYIYRNNGTSQRCTTITTYPGVQNTYCSR